MSDDKEGGMLKRMPFEWWLSIVAVVLGAALAGSVLTRPARAGGRCEPGQAYVDLEARGTEGQQFFEANTGVSGFRRGDIDQVWRIRGCVTLP